MARILVTGATGFIGYHLVKHLSQRGHDVTCLVRRTSSIDRLNEFQPRLAIGDITDLPSLQNAVQGRDVVFHLAGLNRTLSARHFNRVNAEGMRNIADSCVAQQTPPTLVIASSLAAAGPAAPGAMLQETDPPRPVSKYGHSKLRGEQLAMEACRDRAPLTILRPPIVFGESDRDCLPMFTGIAHWGLHFVPTLKEHRYSLIHGADLASAFDLAAQRGQRVTQDDPGKGIYYVSANEHPTYAALGQLIAQAVGQPRLKIIRNPAFAVRTLGAVNHALGLMLRKQQLVNFDKAREAVAGAWICDSSAFRRDTGFQPQGSLSMRLKQTANWYDQQGWLRLPSPARSKRFWDQQKTAH